MPTLQAAAGESGNNKPMVLHTYCLQGGGETSQNSQGSGINEDVSFTLNSTDRHGVAYGFKPMVLQSSWDGTQIAPTLTSRNAGGGQRMPDKENFNAVISYGLDRVSYNPGKNQSGIAVVFNGENVTSPTNKADPKPGDPCHTLDRDSRNYVVFDSRGNGDGKIVPTMKGDHENRVTNTTTICLDIGFFQAEKDKSATILARQYKDPRITYQESTDPLMASGYQKNGTQEAANDMYIVNRMVRRLTPKECERLQGFPDNWTSIGEWTDSKGKTRQTTDSARYKALGNSIALPFWFYLLRRISAQYERPATLGSLFDGIGGFPYCWERCNGPGTAIWASEIDEFCIAVTKKRFPEGEEQQKGVT